MTHSIGALADYQAAVELLRAAAPVTNPIQLMTRPNPLVDWCAELDVRRPLEGTTWRAVGVGDGPVAALINLAEQVRFVLAQEVNT